MKHFASLLAVSCTQRFLASQSQAQPKPLQVFVLAGQSNMEGQGFITADAKRNEGKGSLNIGEESPTTEKFKHFDGQRRPMDQAR